MKNNDSLLEALRRGYTVDRFGNVLSPYSNRVIATCDDGLGYYKFAIKINGTKYNIKVHRLVAFFKFGNAILSKEVRHLNGNSKDNSWDNIDIGTRLDNILDIPPKERVRIALCSAARTRKLNWREVTALRDDRNNGATCDELCRKYDLAQSTVSYIINYKTYRIKLP